MTAEPPTARTLQRALDMLPPGSRGAWELRGLLRRRPLQDQADVVVPPGQSPKRPIVVDAPGTRRRSSTKPSRPSPNGSGAAEAADS